MTLTNDFVKVNLKPREFLSFHAKGEISINHETLLFVRLDSTLIAPHASNETNCSSLRTYFHYHHDKPHDQGIEIIIRRM